ncbi:type IV pilin N-terminal domain-containing protein [Methanosarcina horonobensis]|uniref:type IV pilin N-terminal domain-containing protein n=1 Tax=Methanosarcina horonobensis TaxID=418008 RepID=UPI000A8C756E|nr:type IV pilin N-terminal domain-containing protein [Methanosarcina horonobensis]
MKALGNLRHKLFYFLRSEPKGLSPVIGSLLLLLITFVFVGAIVSTIDLSGSRTNLQPPVARITLESCEGGIYGVWPNAEMVKFEENRIVLMHDGGDSLSLDSISIKISGYGNSYRPVFGQGTLRGNLSVFYLDLNCRGKKILHIILSIIKPLLKMVHGMWEKGLYSAGRTVQ